MRTTTELLAKIKSLSAPESAVRATLLVQLLPFRHAKRFLKPGMTKETWEEVRIEATDQRVRFVIEARMPEAWGAANARNTGHVSLVLTQFELFLWFLGDEHEDAHKAVWDRFEHFGKPQLAMVCNRFGLDWRKWDDGQWHMTVLKASIPAEEALTRWRRAGLRSLSRSPDEKPSTDPADPSTSS